MVVVDADEDFPDAARLLLGSDGRSTTSRAPATVALQLPDLSMSSLAVSLV